mgnify:CR=1 FL=1
MTSVAEIRTLPATALDTRTPVAPDPTDAMRSLKQYLATAGVCVRP